MAVIVKTEKRKRGKFGTFIWWMFLAFNAFMAPWFLYTITIASETVGEGTKAEQQAAAAITAGVLLWLWPLGSVILGLVVVLTGEEVFRAPAPQLPHRKPKDARRALSGYLTAENHRIERPGLWGVNAARPNRFGMSNPRFKYTSDG